MELKQLRQFVMLAETLNFRRAAERLNMAQPPLSISLRKLEAGLGTQLFERTTREMHLTAFGRVFLDRARRTLFEADQALQAARTAATGEEGTLTIGFVGTATYAVLPDLVPAYRAAFPRVQLILRESTTTEILSQIERGTIDLGIVRTPLARANRAHVTPIENDHLVLALPVSHPLAQRPGIRLRDLEGEPFIAYSPNTVPSLHAVVMFACQQAGFTPNVAQEAIQVQTIISLVESGLGVALVPSIVTRSGDGKTRFRRLPELDAMAPVSLAIAHAPQWETAAARHFRTLAISRTPAPSDSRLGTA
ncbi:LysR family transcriptional regulator [Xanthobacter dioxanivorans]|uniref:LysR family transcriptional regulator n=1 Tax=Xanthobacter dioxanivorans TaxID=2528964 RepID=A0A974SIG3_9HYPH|nr:LysR family transcriptional regulator [Xanthobacter dioxanivorans]QRG07361.1 LysR family transcriptional regulator [Xanthobacter dioxanivorans]